MGSLREWRLGCPGRCPFRAHPAEVLPCPSPLTPPRFDVRPLTPTIGAEISGLDLRNPLADSDLSELRTALLRYKVIFFRDQDISTDQHLALARSFGQLEVHPFAPHKPGYPEVLAITHDETVPGRENVWHSDVTWRQQPSLGSILRCLQCPEVGGDTLFSDMCAAFANLPEKIQERVAGLRARHDFPHFRSALRRAGRSEAEIEELEKQYPNPEHPVIRTHPETGQPAIYVNQAFTQEIVGLPEAESRELLQFLYRQAHKPEFQCRFHWEPNSIAFWDNRSCQHYASSDYWPARRSVERVTIVGDTPFYEPYDRTQLQNSDRYRGSLAAARASEDLARQLA